MQPEQTMFAETIKRLKAWYLDHYKIPLTNSKLAEQVTQRIGRRAYFRTIASAEAGLMPAWDVATALQDIEREWLCSSTRGVDESAMTQA